MNNKQQTTKSNLQTLQTFKLFEHSPVPAGQNCLNAQFKTTGRGIRNLSGSEKPDRFE